MALDDDPSLPETDILLSAEDREKFLSALAEHFPSERAAALILGSIHFPAGQIPFFENSDAYDAWEQILSEISMGIIRAGHYQLLREALRRYMNNQVFAGLYETYVSGPVENRVRAAQETVAPANDSLRDDPLLPETDILLSPEDREKLLRELAVCFPSQRAAEMMLRSTTFPAGRIPSFENFTTHDVWEEILSEISMGIIRAGHYQLLREALRRYPTNRVFAELYETYVSGQAADRVTGTQIASLLHGLRVQGPDGRQFLVDDAPAEQTVGDLAANIADHYFEGSVFERESLVADAVGSDGEGHRLDPTLTLALAGISDGDLVRVNWQPGRQLRTVSPRGRASTAQEVVKVILVGEGAAGKTSLITAIGNKPFEESTRTHGIDIQSLAVDDLESGIQVTLRFWDFGGQPVYRITHPLFFSAHALYLVVWSARVGSEKDDVRGWLTRITQRVGDAAAIMIVATHRDEAPDTELDYAALEQEFPGLLQGDYRVDNKSRTGIPELREAIARQAVHLSRSMSAPWVRVANEIFALAADRPQVSYDEFSAVCKEHGLGQRDVEDLASLLHRQGWLVYQSDDETLRDLVILDPEWSSKAVGLILKDARTRNDNGILDHDRLPELWEDRLGEYHYARHHYIYLLRLMEKFEISYRMEDGRHSLITPLVPTIRPVLPWDSGTPVPEGVRRLRLISRFSSGVPWLIPALTARLGAHGTQSCWRTGVFLHYPVPAYASEALLELNHQTELSLEVRAPSPDLYLHVLQDSIQYLARQWPGLGIELRIPCPADVPGGCPGQFRLERLLAARESGGSIVTCPECPAELQITALLTGFTTPTAQDLAVRALFLDIKSDLDTMHSDIRGMQAIAASSADDLRRLLTAVATEITDCPRLFTVTSVEAEGLAKVKFYQRHFRLTLWCESPDHWHPCRDGIYPLDKNPQWIQNAIRYARLVLTVLRVAVPFAGILPDLMPASAHPSDAKREIDLMKDLLKAVPHDLPDDQDWILPDSDERPSPLDSAYLRGVRQMLFDIDPHRHFGGLSRIQATSGEYLWVCPEHRTTDHRAAPDDHIP